jgi:hypothetical protein
MSRTNEFRQNAEKFRRLAETGTNPVIRNAWFRISDQWDRLADEATRHPEAFLTDDGP